VAHGFRCKTLQQCGLRPLAAIDHAIPMLRRGPSKWPLVHRAAFCRLKRRSADFATSHDLMGGLPLQHNAMAFMTNETTLGLDRNFWSGKSSS
jgi:hypothetical protein